MRRQTVTEWLNSFYLQEEVNHDMTNELYNKLSAYENKKKEIKELDAQIHEYEMNLLPNGIRYDMDKIQTSPTDPMSKLLSEVGDLMKKRDILSLEASKELAKLKQFIDQLLNGNERLILKYRWINNLSWSEISEKLSYSEEWCYKHNRKAIADLEKLI